jgi:hypothetical protein
MVGSAGAGVCSLIGLLVLHCCLFMAKHLFVFIVLFSVRYWRDPATDHSSLPQACFANGLSGKESLTCIDEAFF